MVIPSKHVDGRKLEAMKYLGIIERDGNNIKLSPAGQDYAAADPSGKALAIQACLANIPLYYETIEWLHHSGKGDQTKTQLANYWHDHQSAKLEGASGAALTDATIFFMRVIEASGISHFVPAGRGRPESYLEVDAEAIKTFLAGPRKGPSVSDPPVSPTSQLSPTATVSPPAEAQFSFVPGVHVNIEIHIAADAKATTVEEIFKNMRKYVLNRGDDGT